MEMIINKFTVRYKKIKKTQITKIRNKKDAITIDLGDIKIIREYYKQLYTHRFYNIEKVD